MLFANTWLFRPLIEMVMSRERTTDALLRTTTAITMINGGVKVVQPETFLPNSFSKVFLF